MRKTLVTLFASLLADRTAAAAPKATKHQSEPLLVLIAVLSPFAAALFISFFYSRLKDHSAYIGAASGLLSFVCVLSLLGTHGSFEYSWIPSLGMSLEFYVDGLSLLIASLASGIGTLVFLYSRKYMEHESRKRKYYTVLTAFMGSMIGLVFSSNLLMLFMFWEFTSICSFLLISHSQDTVSAIKASKKSLIVTVSSGIMLLLSFIIIGNALGTYSIAEILSMKGVSETLISQGVYMPVLALLGVGAGAKSAQFPLHIWLPDAMEAPTPVSSFLHSATMVKAGVFLIGRFRPILMQGEFWNILFLFLGFLTMTVGALLAFRSEKLKELLAYSTASHLGLIVAGFGFSSVYGGETASFHIFNHAIFKASLFMVAGIVLHEAGTQKFSKLSGLGKDWPKLKVIATVSGLSMAGLPLLNGFYSKELLYKSSYKAATGYGGLSWIIPALAVTGSIFTFLYSLKFISAFYGEESDLELHSIPGLMLVSPGLLALTAVLAGIKPGFFIERLVAPALGSVSAEAHGMSVHVIPHLSAPFMMSVVTFLSGGLLFWKRRPIIQKIDYLANYRLLNANFYYKSFLSVTSDLSDFVTDRVETGLLRTYVIWVVFVAVLSGVSGYHLSGVTPSMLWSAQIPVIVVLATSVASVYAVIRANTYISSVLTLSILGFMVSIFYLLMDAPDLVMTQLVVESLSLIIFLLVLNKIPDYTKKISFSRKYRDFLLSGAAGLLVFSSVMYSTMEKTPSNLSDFYIDRALPGSGGTNVVNVILVDFRGLDTMGEISVVVMAGLAILMLFRMRGDEE